MKIVIVFLIVVIAYAVTVAYVNRSPPYEREVRDWYDLQAVRYYPDEDFILMSDLDSTTAGYTRLASPTANRGKGWEPIGTALEPFAGNFDGQGYEIRDLFIDRHDKDKLDWNIGLFGRVHTWGTIKNVGVVNVNIIGWWYVGGLVGYNWGTVSNSYSTGNVTGLLYAGGLVGCQSYNTVSNSYSTSNVTAINYVGGLAGYNREGTVSDSYSTGNINGDMHVGGLVGTNSGIVSNSYSTSNVTGTSHSGGLVGLLRVGTVENSFWDTETSGMEVSYGGIGKNTTEMQDIATFSGADWNITAVANPSTRNPSHIWNIVDDETYPFLSWQSVS